MWLPAGRPAQLAQQGHQQLLPGRVHGSEGGHGEDALAAAEHRADVPLRSGKRELGHPLVDDLGTERDRNQLLMLDPHVQRSDRIHLLTPFPLPEKPDQRTRELRRSARLRAPPPTHIQDRAGFEARTPQLLALQFS